MSLPDPNLKSSYEGSSRVWKYANSDNSLTPGQIRFIQALCETGLRSTRLASHLGLSVKTIDTYREQVKTRWGLLKLPTDIALFKEAVKRGYYEFPKREEMDALQLGAALRAQERNLNY